MAKRSLYEYNMADAIETLLSETTSVSTVKPERIFALRALAAEARVVRDAVLEYESARASAVSTTGSLTSEPSGSGPKQQKARGVSTSSELSDLTGEFYDPSESSDSGDSDSSGIGKEARSMAEFCYNTICHDAYMRIVEDLVRNLRVWLMELEEAKYETIDFDAPPKRWTRKEKIIFRAEIREMSYEIRKKHVLQKMMELNKRRTSIGPQTLETKLAIEMIELLLQDMFLLRVMPFKDVVFPIHVNNVYDWDRVSKAIKGTHNPAECQEAWFTKFHPKVNWKAWSKAENRKLMFYADVYNLHHWDEIAKCMQTNRSGFQCYVQYRRFLYKDKPVVLKLSQQPKANAKGQKKA